MSSDEAPVTPPKSMRHKRILDVAEEHPDASKDQIASMVPSATRDLVDRVFEKYGDPAASDASALVDTEETNDERTETTGPADTSDSDPEVTRNGGNADSDPPSTTPPSLDELSQKQREVLRAVAATPATTQQVIADRLGVSRATVSKRLNSIEEFEWEQREAFVERVAADLEPEQRAGDHAASDEAAVDGGRHSSHEQSLDGSGLETALADVETALGQLEARVEDLESRPAETPTGQPVFDDPELVHKVLHACLEVETISEDEELRIIQRLMT